MMFPSIEGMQSKKLSKIDAYIADSNSIDWKTYRPTDRHPGPKSK